MTQDQKIAWMGLGSVIGCLTFLAVGIFIIEAQEMWGGGAFGLAVGLGWASRIATVSMPEYFRSKP